MASKKIEEVMEEEEVKAGTSEGGKVEGEVEGSNVNSEKK